MLSDEFYEIVLRGVQDALGHSTFVTNESLGKKLVLARMRADVIVEAVHVRLSRDNQEDFNQEGMRQSLRSTIERVVVMLPHLVAQASNTQRPLDEIVAALVVQAGRPYLKRSA